jgi:hypothetical protein
LAAGGLTADAAARASSNSDSFHGRLSSILPRLLGVSRRDANADPPGAGVGTRHDRGCRRDRDRDLVGAARPPGRSRSVRPSRSRPRRRAECPKLYADLEDRDVPHWIRSRIRDVALGNRREAWHLVADVLPTLGESHSTIEDIVATAGIFGAVNETGKHTLAVVVDREFTNLERRDRVPICRLIATLAQAFDVRFVATTVTRAFVRNHHREDLPGVSEWRVTDREHGPLGDVVENAIVDLDPDGREVQLLRALEAESSETPARTSLSSAGSGSPTTKSSSRSSNTTRRSATREKSRTSVRKRTAR